MVAKDLCRGILITSLYWFVLTTKNVIGKSEFSKTAIGT